MDCAPDLLFRALADETRLRCLLLLLEQGELCVCELTHALGLSQPKISRHLGTLREAALVSDRRAGHWVYYRLHPQIPPWAREVLRATAQGARARSPFAEDAASLAQMPNRPGGRCCA